MLLNQIIFFSIVHFFFFLVYRQDVIDLFSAPVTNSFYSSLNFIRTETNSTHWLTSVLILVPLRLGLNELDLIYEDYLKEALKLPQTVGIIGGSPRHAVYIIGFQDDNFINLDPHLIQSTVNVLEDKFDMTVGLLDFLYLCQANLVFRQN